MYKIVDKKELNTNVISLTVSAPLIAKKVQAGQFVIVRVNENGERIPLTVADFDREKGTVTIIVQVVGRTTILDEIKTLHQKENITVILVSHSLEDIARYANRIIVMEKGEINGVGTHEELLASNSIYKEVYESQVKGGEE